MLLAAVIALVVATGVFAQAFSVDYLDGTVELKIPKDKAGNEWKALAIGDSVASDASLRVGPSSSVELTRAGFRIAILKPGIYQVTELAKARAKLKGTEFARAVVQKAGALTQDRVKQGTVGGSRGDPNSYKGIRETVALGALGGSRGAGGGTSDQSVMWVEGDPDGEEVAVARLTPEQWKEYMTKSRTLAIDEYVTKAGNFDGAASELRDLIEFAPDPALTAEPRYLLAAVYSWAGQPLKAYSILDQTPPEILDQEYSAKFALLKAQVLIDILDFQETKALLEHLLEQKQTVENAQNAYLLSV